MQGLGVPRRGGENLAVDMFSLRQPPGGVKLLALPEQGVDLLRPFAHGAR